MKKLLFIINGLVLFTSCQSMAEPSISVGFSPEGTAQQLVLQTINDAHKTLNVLGYTFTSPEVVKSLIAAHRRGVQVRIALDEKGNHYPASERALRLLVNAGIPVRISSNYTLMHDKVTIADGRTVQTGSFNYTRAADRQNSENVVVLKDMPDVAEKYLNHWQTRWDGAQPAIAR